MAMEPCEPEFIDGSYYGCGSCPECLEDEDEEIERQVEMGDLTDEEAQEKHRDNYARRTMAGLYDEEVRDR